MAVNNYVMWPGSRIKQDETYRLVTDVQIAAWNSKSDAAHTHTKSQITDFPASLKNPTSVVIKLNSGTTEGTNMFTYDGSAAKSINITSSSIGAAAASHNHTVANITDFPESLKNPNSISIQLNSGTATTYDGSAAKSINITAASVGAAAASHTHQSADITSLDASKLTGTIDIARLPAGALERLYPVADSAARLKLTKSDVQNGDTVKENDTGLMYFVSDDTKLGTDNAAEAFTAYTAGSATSVPWSGVTGKPDTFAPAAHKHVKADITDFPASLKNPTSVKIQLNGGTTEGTNQFTYDGSAAKSINITPTGIGAAASSHTHSITEITDLADLSIDSKTVTDWNSVITSGEYYSDSNASNVPTTTSGATYCGSVVKGVKNVIQTLYIESDSLDSDVYKYIRRGKLNDAKTAVTTWGEWHEVMYIIEA